MSKVAVLAITLAALGETYTLVHTKDISLCKSAWQKADWTIERWSYSAINDEPCTFTLLFADGFLYTGEIVIQTVHHNASLLEQFMHYCTIHSGRGIGYFEDVAAYSQYLSMRGVTSKRLNEYIRILDTYDFK